MLQVNYKICNLVFSFWNRYTLRLATLIAVAALYGCPAQMPPPTVTRVNDLSRNSGGYEPYKPISPGDKPSRSYRPSSQPVTLPPVTIVVDPGHGGKDPGAWGDSLLPEKSIVLSVSNQLARLLDERGAHVIMTRSTDRFISLNKRAASAERNRADLFISIHADASRKTSASGATVLIGRTASRRSKRAAWCIKSALQRAGIKCRKIRAQHLIVLENHSRPAVLVETGFLTNPSDARNLNSNWYRSKITAAIAQGIANYFNR